MEMDTPQKKSFTVRVDPETHKALRRIAVEEDTSLTAILDQAISAYLKSKGVPSIPARGNK